MSGSYEDIIDEMEKEMRRMSDELLLQMFRIPGASGEVWAPRADVYETNEELVVKICAAGLKAKDMDISLSADGRYLSIRGIRAEGSAERRGRIRYYQLEVYYGPFERVIPLPHSVNVDRDKIHAAYRDGFLKVTLPKTKPTPACESRSIPISD